MESGGDVGRKEDSKMEGRLDGGFAVRRKGQIRYAE